MDELREIVERDFQDVRMGFRNGGPWVAAADDLEKRVKAMLDVIEAVEQYRLAKAGAGGTQEEFDAWLAVDISFAALARLDSLTEGKAHVS